VSYSPPPTAIAGPPRAWRMPWPQRLVMVAAGSALLALLVTASRLTPNPRGMGTHQRLGLPPCTIIAVFGFRCPSCGMTTSWAHLMRGNVSESFRGLVVSGLWGRWLVAPPHEWAALGCGLAIVAVTLVDWSLRLTYGW
jgi:hypothetical protein